MNRKYGLAMEKMIPLRRAKVFAKVAIPLILGAMVKSQQLEVVLQSKAFSGSSNYTYIHESRLGWQEDALFVFFSIFFIISLILLIGWGIGTFGGPI